MSVDTANSLPENDLETPSWLTKCYSSFLAVLVLLLLLWPIAHRFMVVHFGVNPWKGFGVAMYCTAVPSTLDILIPTKSGFHKIPINSNTPKSLRDEFENYLNKRHTLGHLAGPPSRKFVEQVFVLDQNLTDVLFRSESLWLNPHNNMLELRNRSTFHYRMMEGQLVLYDFDHKSGEHQMQLIDI